MKSTLAIAAAAMLALWTPVFAQSAGDAGATGAAGSATGHNPPGTAGATSARVGGMENGGAMRMKEGRAAARNAPTGDKADDTPKSVRGDQNKQDQTK